MSTADDRDRIRIGDTERDAADKALQRHLAAGRLSMDEYSDRVARVYSARTRADLTDLFSDLPAGDSAQFGSPSPHSQVQPAASSSVSPQPSNPPATSRGTRTAILALLGAMPFIALLLFFRFGTWWVFLLIPLVGALLGPFLNRNDRRD